jgi:hypothetical protein
MNKPQAVQSKNNYLSPGEDNPLNQSRTSSSRVGEKADRNALKKRDDIWADNIHILVKHDNPNTTQTLNNHNRQFEQADKFIDYVNHVEN